MKKNNKNISIKKAKRHKKNLRRLSRKDNSEHYLNKFMRQRSQLQPELNLTPEAQESLQKALEDSLMIDDGTRFEEKE